MMSASSGRAGQLYDELLRLALKAAENATLTPEGAVELHQRILQELQHWPLLEHMRAGLDSAKHNYGVVEALFLQVDNPTADSERPLVEGVCSTGVLVSTMHPVAGTSSTS